MKRFRDAFRFNEPQLCSSGFMTLAGAMVLLSSENTTWWLWVLVLLFWPGMAFLVNFISGPPP